jgi:hypothetical protein
LSRTIDQEKIDKQTLSRDEALYARDRGMLPADYPIPGDEETYENELKALEDHELLRLARNRGLSPEASAFSTSGGKPSKTKLISALVALREGGEPINPDPEAVNGGTPAPDDGLNEEDDSGSEQEPEKASPKGKSKGKSKSKS